MYTADMKLDIVEEEGDDLLPEEDIDDDLGAYQGTSGGRTTTSHSATRSREHENTESELTVRPFLGRFYRLACLSTLRLLRLPRIRLNISNCGCISIACRTTRSLSLSALRAANNVYGSPAL